MTPSEQRTAAVVDALADRGFVPAGHTASETVRVATRHAPVFGGIGGELRTFGGRQRCQLPGTEWYVTVGPRTVNFYRKLKVAAYDFHNFNTRDLDRIASFADSLKAGL